MAFGTSKHPIVDITKTVTAPLSEDFTIARLFESSDRLVQIGDALKTLGDGTEDISRAAINDAVPADDQLSAIEAEALFVGLSLNGVAEKSDQNPSFADATFRVSISEATQLLAEQSVVIKGIAQTSEVGGSNSDIEILATIPEQLQVDISPQVKDLDTTVRSMLLEAADTVRIANPYFDPQHPTVATLRTLPQRGVETKILTRGLKSGSDRCRVVNQMYESLTKGQRQLVRIGELHQYDSSGGQTYATHAKLAIRDEVSCYVGSANFTVTNLDSNFELGLLAHEEAVAIAADTFDAVFDASQTFGLQELDK